MVSARAGVMPANAISRTAAEAPVANFKAPIPGNPFISLPGRARLNRVIASFPSQYPSTPYSPHSRVGTPPRPNQSETLDVRHPGHTSDLERYLRAGLENERREALKPG